MVRVEEDPSGLASRLDQSETTPHRSKDQYDHDDRDLHLLG
jgi:hypothetical protein